MYIHHCRRRRKKKLWRLDIAHGFRIGYMFISRSLSSEHNWVLPYYFWLSPAIIYWIRRRKNFGFRHHGHSDLFLYRIHVHKSTTVVVDGKSLGLAKVLSFKITSQHRSQFSLLNIYVRLPLCHVVPWKAWIIHAPSLPCASIECDTFRHVLAWRIYLQHFQ